jgi:hypothetical protein
MHLVFGAFIFCHLFFVINWSKAIARDSEVCQEGLIQIGTPDWDFRLGLLLAPFRFGAPGLLLLAPFRHSVS